MSTSEDLVNVLTWLMETKTPPTRIAQAMDRLREYTLRGMATDPSLHLKIDIDGREMGRKIADLPHELGQLNFDHYINKEK